VVRSKPEKRSGNYRRVIDIGIDPITKKRRRRSITASTIRELDEKVAAALLEARKGPPPTKAKTFGDLLASYWAAHEDALSPGSVRGYVGIMRRYLRPAFGDRPLHKLKPGDFSDLYTHLMTVGVEKSRRGKDGKVETWRRPLTLATIRKIHAVVAVAYDHAIDREWCRTNVADAVRLPKTKPRSKAKRKAATIKQIGQVLEATKPPVGTDLVDAAMLAMAVGIREGEVCGLMWPDVDLDARTLQVNATVAEVGAGRLLRVETERKSDERLLALDPGTVAMLTRRHAYAAQVALRFKVPIDRLYVIGGKVPGQPLAPNLISGRWRNACKRAGVTGVRFHDLRHFTVSHWLDAGLPVPLVVEAAGWTSAQMVSTYGHTVRRVDTRPAEVMARVLAPLRRADPSG
jgi:integrase